MILTSSLMIRVPELLNKVWGLQGRHQFSPCVRIVESGSASAGLPCYRVEVAIKCRLTRQLVCGWLATAHWLDA